ncbi:NusA-like transcription termination signal-binding factor [Methanotorris igneus]|uniref:Probable transcription termination protein NusA n=1 Tax=Methanotorris igneus (strain DSM 5666 / JCM 11834 / Kol 5) TaxID=880724 RepID=F6BAZ2_METIK|nr:NusA-like transcription termination signal-binding factor [Methanotorris igneus]AEF97079.1 NusA family KH domain protein [Methanotorris igneus Kol 5]
MKVRLTTEEIMKIGYFEKLSGATVIDCICDDDRIVFVVKEGDIGAAIGKGGENVKTAMEKFGKKIDIIEYSSDLKKFIKNIFAPIELEDVWFKKINGELIAYVRINPKFRRAVIGNRGRNIERAVQIARRHTDVKNIRVIVGNRRRPFRKRFGGKKVLRDTSKESVEMQAQATKTEETNTEQQQTETTNTTTEENQ